MTVYGLDRSSQLEADLDIQPLVSQFAQIYGDMKGRQGRKKTTQAKEFKMSSRRFRMTLPSLGPT